MEIVRTRLAPSPTGSMHIGTLRTALYCYAWAKKNQGEYLLRIEDTDQKRYVAGSVEQIIDIHELCKLIPDQLPGQVDIDYLQKQQLDNRFGLDWVLKESDLNQVDDEEFAGVMLQTRRLPVYQKYARKLITKGFAYICFCDESRLETLKQQQQANKQQPKYDGHCKKYSLEESLEKVRNGEPYVVRLNVEAYKKWKNQDYVDHTDTVMGKVRFPLSEVDDQVLIKSNGIPTYHLAVVVDDHLMNITHAFRGVEWISSTPKQLILFETLGWESPQFAHLSILLDPNGGKLSKRKGAVAVLDFLSQGYLPEALLNFLMLLGWAHPNRENIGESESEFFTLDEFVQLFDLSGLNKSNPVFNREKLAWFNQKYIAKLTTTELTTRYADWAKKYADSNYSADGIESKITLVQERAQSLSHLHELLKPFFAPEIKYEQIKQIEKLSTEQVSQIVKDFLSELATKESVTAWGHHDWEAFVRSLAEKLEIKAGEAFMVLRLATLGSPFSPPLFESMEVLGKQEVSNRLETYIGSIE